MHIQLTASDDELKRKFFAMTTPRDIAELLEVEYALLIYYLYKVPEDERYQTFTINKRAGGVRHISAPATPLKIIQKKLNYVLQQVYQVKAPAHAYVPEKSIITNAEMHLRKRYVLNVDLRGFFPSINFRRVRGLFEATPYNRNRSVSTVLARICCHKNLLPQGAPSSPIVSNMICSRMDSQLRRLAMRHRCVYTRYADDLTFSTSLRTFPQALASVSPSTTGNKLIIGPELDYAIKSNGFKINESKIRLQTSDRRQVVTGLTVNRRLNVSRRYTSQIRAMLHAWEMYGLENAESDFRRYDKKNRSSFKPDVSFKDVVKGKIEFLGMVRGKDDATYLRFLSQLADLAPELVPKSKEEIDEKRALLIKLKDVLISNFDTSELRELYFDLGIDDETVSGAEAKKTDIAIDLIKYMERYDRMSELINMVSKRRPSLI